MEEKKIVVKEELKEVKDVASEPMIRTSNVGTVSGGYQFHQHH